MDFRWVTQISEEELNAAMTAIQAEITTRSNAKAKKLRNAINEALDNLCNEYPNACWMVEFEDDNGDWLERDLLNDFTIDADDIIL